MSDYEYEIKELAPDLLGTISQLVKEGDQLLLENSSGISGAQGAWIEALGSIISEIDPDGRPMSDSIWEQWRTSKWYLRSRDPKNPKEEAAVFGQLLGVARSLTRGRFKAVKRRIGDSTMVTASIFHQRPLTSQDELVFVLMPFSERWSDYIWKKQIKPIVEGIAATPLTCKRADDLFGHDVMVDVYESIATARIVIAEVTNRNANVFYELGIAHTLGKDVILLAQGSEHIPFDLNRFRHCIYSNDGPGYEVLREYLPSAIATIIGCSASPRT